MKSTEMRKIMMDSAERYRAMAESIYVELEKKQTIVTDEYGAERLLDQFTLIDRLRQNA